MKTTTPRLRLLPEYVPTMTQDGRTFLCEMQRVIQMALRENDSDAIEWAALQLGEKSRAFEARHADQIARIHAEKTA